MTGPEILAYIKRTFKRTDKDTELYEAITDTIIDIKQRHPFDEFKEEAYSGTLSTIGEFKLDLPDDFSHLVSDVRVEDGDVGFVLTKRSKNEFDLLYPHPYSTNPITGRPTDYCIFGGEVLLGPVPDDLSLVYEFSYALETVTAIDADSTTVPFSEMNRECLKYGALRRVYADMGNDEEALKWAQHYEAEIQKMIYRDVENTKGFAVTKFNDL